MSNPRKGSIYIAVLFCVIISNSALAWDDKITHRALTEEAVKLIEDNWFGPYLQNNLGFIKNVQEMLPYENKQMTIRDILKEGSEREDDWPNWPRPENARFMNHFHSPIYNMGLSQGEVCLHLLFRKICFQLEGESALAWARGTGVGCKEAEKCTGNEYSWFEARYHYRSAFEAESATDRDRELANTFRSLGQVMHLVQDMSVPAHTRNDSLVGHLLSVGNNLEKFLARKENRHFVTDNGTDVQIPNFNHLSTEDSTTELSYFWDTDEYLGGNFENAFDNDIGLAEYSSANFLSTGRMFEESTEFPHPSMDDIESVDWTNPELGMAENGTYDSKIYFRKKNDGYRLSVAGSFTRAYLVRMPGSHKYLKTTHLDKECH